MGSQPNIVFIHVDQMMPNVVTSCAGKADGHLEHVSMPGLEEIAANGISFTKSYCADPVCVPARTSWFTGRAACEHGVLRNEDMPMIDIPNIGRWMNDHTDYLSVYTGKTHISTIDRIENSFKVLQQAGAKGEYCDTLTTESVISFLNNYSGEKPFFLTAGLLNPHDCCYNYGAAGGMSKWDAGEVIDGEYIPGKLPPLPKNFINQSYKNIETTDQWHYYIYQYYRQCEMVDALIQRIWETLQSSKFADNTLFIFSSDHGESAGSFGRTSKGVSLDNVWRVPLICTFPGKIQPGVVDDTSLVTAVDITSTICDYSGSGEMPDMSIAQSLRPLFENSKKPWREYVVGEIGMERELCAVRDKKYKTTFFADGKTKIYDLDRDPYELKDVAKTDEGKKVRADHLEYMKDYLTKVKPCPVEPRMRRAKKGSKNIRYLALMDFYDKVKKGTY